MVFALSDGITIAQGFKGAEDQTAPVLEKFYIRTISWI